MNGEHSEVEGPSTGTPGSGLTELETKVIDRLGQFRSIVDACHRRMGSPLSRADLEEAVQEASLSAWVHRASFRGDSDIDTWMYGIARFTILGQLRRGRRSRMVEFQPTDEFHHPVDPTPGPEDLVDTGVLRVIDHGLAEAGTTAAKICRARALGEQSFVEIGAELRVSESNVKARFYRSLPQLRRRLRSLWTEGYGRGYCEQP